MSKPIEECLIERVALAMALSDGDYKVTDHWRRRASAAIKAMIEEAIERERELAKANLQHE